MGEKNNKLGNKFYVVYHEQDEGDEFEGLSPMAQLLYMRMIKWRNKKGKGRPSFQISVSEMASSIGVSDDVIYRSKRELREKGFIVEYSGKVKRNTNTYVLTHTKAILPKSASE